MNDSDNNNLPFLNPWCSLPKDQIHRNSLEVAKEYNEKILQICPKTGVIRTTINLLLKKLVDELERSNITSYAPDDYAFAVANCTITLGGATPEHGVPRGTNAKPASRRKRAGSAKETRGNDGPRGNGVA